VERVASWVSPGTQPLPGQSRAGRRGRHQPCPPRQPCARTPSPARTGAFPGRGKNSLPSRAIPAKAALPASCIGAGPSPVVMSLSKAPGSVREVALLPAGAEQLQM